MADLLKKVLSKEIDRRTFLKGGAAVTAAAALGLTLGTGENSLVQAAAPPSEAGGKWITAACWHNCGGRCLNKALVVDGVVVRQKTDDTHPDSPDYPQQRGCIRGRAQRMQVFGADRLKYPMKRKNWEPGGGNKELRGQDEWVRISWDEALDIVASEITRIKDTYGNRSIFANGSEIGRALNLAGGYTGHWGTTSRGSYTLTPGIVGFEPVSEAGINDRLDMRNTETVIMVGMNPAWSSAGNPAYHLAQVRNAGAKFIAVDPYYNETYSTMGAEWIPIRPCTDTAMYLGIAHTLLMEDHPVNNPLIDWDFLQKYTIGFDAASMPAGENPRENFKDYVLGTYDGIPKTAEWASEICGAAPDKIRYLARELRKDKKVSLLTGWANARTHNSDSLPQMVMTIGAMTGHFGKSGHMAGISCHSRACSGGGFLTSTGSAGLPAIANGVTDSINDTEIWKAIVTGKYNYTGRQQYLPGEIRDIDIHMIYHGGGTAALQTREGMSTGIAAHRKVDFVVCNAHFLTTQAKYSDVVLPVITEWEKEGGMLSGNREILIMYSQITEPLYEAKSDQWVATEVAKRLGFSADDIYPLSTKQQLFNSVSKSTAVLSDGKTRSPIVTITDSDIAEWGVEGTPQQGIISLKEFKENGLFQIERKPGDKYGFLAFKAFIDDPEANPRSSESGKMEIFSRKLADTVNNMGFSTIKPIPTYIQPVEGYEATFSDWNSRTKGDYPYQVVNPHYLRRSHSILDNNIWLREAWPNPVYINAGDARAKGIETGDTVLLTSKHGKTLRTALVTERFMPGVIGLPHGSWVDMDEKTGIDTGGADNILCGPISTGHGVSGWNSCVANLEKYSGASIIRDIDKPLFTLNA